MCTHEEHVIPVICNNIQMSSCLFHINQVGNKRGLQQKKSKSLQTKSSTTPWPNPSLSKTVASNPKLEILAAIWDGNK